MNQANQFGLSSALQVLRAVCIAALVTAHCPLPTAHAQLVEDLPEEIKDVGVDEHRGDTLPLDLEFVDENGNTIKLRDIFNGDRPVLLSLNYSDCPLLCRVQLNGLVDGVRDLDWTAGDEYTIVSVSINPNEKPERAKQTEERYLRDYGRPNAAKGWYFLTGSEENIKQLAAAVGFRYKFVVDTGEFSHTAALMVCTPNGVISRYLYGVLFEEPTLRLAMVEAGEGKVGSAIDQLILFCFHYDETKGRYGPTARRIMQLGAMTTVSVMAIVLVPFWMRKRPPAVQSTAAASDVATPTDSPPSG